MELDISHLVDSDFDAALCSGSIAELGENAGRITWNNSVRESAARPLLTDGDSIQEAKDYFAGFGAWDREEIESWDDAETNALMLQFIAGDIREMESCEDWEDYIRQSEAGRIGGRISRDDAGRYWYYVGE